MLEGISRKPEVIRQRMGLQKRSPLIRLTIGHGKRSVGALEKNSPAITNLAMISSKA